MGTSISHYPATPSNYPVFSLTIRAHDKIKVIDANVAVVNIVRQNLRSHYGKIQNEWVGNDGGTCFKLSGFPFCKTGGFNLSVKTKHFFVELISELYRTGWKLWLNSDLSRMYDFSTLFFHQSPSAPTNFSLCCLSLSSYDKFQLIDAPEVLYDALLSCVGNLLQAKNVHDHCLEVKMYGNLWHNCNFSESTNARTLLLNIIRTFRQYSYAFFGTVNLKGTADSIFFINEGVSLPQEQYCVISLNAKDRLRLIDCPKNLIDMAAQMIVERWPGGLQDSSKDGECVEYKMKGYPWYAFGRDAAVTSRQFVTTLLQESVRRGWAVMTSLDVSRKPSDKAVFVMRSCASMPIPHFCIAPADRDKIRIIGADDLMERLVADVIKQAWTPGIQDQSDCNSLELKLRGYPWQCYSFSDSFALARIMMTRILTALEERGWSAICSADVSAKFISNSDNRSHDHPCDVHSWFIAQTSLISAQAGPSSSFSPEPFGFAPPSYKEAMYS
ncbi:hypothetical protein QR680_005069 [Steinernema hermaphroditum]|uniref:Uncharacterized protein n=1 Tax=Steinernema hermaphroditum TaxID=289476 RepID=A0AA39HQR6_9BILA|nr:hypothetical protein QR680_005069 [Steinernema hermaphroditum]